MARVAYGSLGDLLEERAKLKERGITFIDTRGEEKIVSYQELYKKALAILFNLQQEKLTKGSELIFQIKSNEEFIHLAWACFLGGIIPVPITVGNREEHREKLGKVWQSLLKPNLILNKDVLCNLEKNNYFNNLKKTSSSKILLMEEMLVSRGEGRKEEIQGEDLAFIQFSSGSTGEPKGVLLSHKNLLANILAIAEKFSQSDSTLSWLPLTHDLGFIGFHLAPIFRAIDQVHMETNLFIRNPSKWLEVVAEKKITITGSPNFGYKYYLNSYKNKNKPDLDLSSLRTILNGAEPISIDLVREFIHTLAKDGLRSNAILPAYGLAESCVAVTMPPLGEEIKTHSLDRKHLGLGEKIKEIPLHHWDALELVDLGYPVRATSLRIVDGEGQELEEGTIGHLEIKGASLAQGYYGQDPFANDGWLTSGDLGFLLNGRLTLTGRAKDIIFINGKNYYAHDLERMAQKLEGVELGKIAVCGIYNYQLALDELVIFLVHKGSLDKFLAQKNKLETLFLEKLGLETTKIIPLAKIPMTTSGKVRRFKLEEDFKGGAFQGILEKIKALEASKETPLTTKELKLIGPLSYEFSPQEKYLASLWAEHLNLELVNISDNFYSLGGNSIIAASLANRVSEHLGRDIGIYAVLKYPTIPEFLSYLEEENIASPIPLEKISPREVFQVTPAQRGLYIIQELAKDSRRYSENLVITLEGKIDLPRIKESLQEIVKRHEILRTTFKLEKGKVVQVIAEKINLPLTYLEASEEDLERIIPSLDQVFDLNKGPLFNLVMVRTSEDKAFLFFACHHIIADGTSSKIFFKEFSSLVLGGRLAPLKKQYKDYAHWHNKRLEQTSSFLKERDYWLEIFSQGAPSLKLASDYPRANLRKFSCLGETFFIEGELYQKIKALQVRLELTLFTIFLAAFSILLGKYSNQEDLVIGVPIDGRNHRELEDLLGLFINSVALRTYPNQDKLWEIYLREVQESMMGALTNRDYPFEDLVSKLDLPREINRNPLFDVFFSLLVGEDLRVEGKNINISAQSLAAKEGKFDLALTAYVKDKGVDFCLEYYDELYKKETIKMMVNDYLSILKFMVEGLGTRLGDIDLASVEDLKTNYTSENIEFNF